MDEQELAKRIKSGSVLAQVTFEIVGSPKEHVEKSIRDYLENIKRDSQIEILSEEIGEAEALEGGMFGTFADTEMLFAKLEKINWLCVNFMPASVEIISPSDFKVSERELTAYFNDLLAKLHEISISYRKMVSSEQLFVQNMNAMIQNAVLLASEHYHDIKSISQRTGVPEDQLTAFLDALVKGGKLSKQDDGYHRVK